MCSEFQICRIDPADIANLRILGVTEIKTVAEVPLSLPFIERLVGTIRRELLDQVPFWSARDLDSTREHSKHLLPDIDLVMKRLADDPLIQAVTAIRFPDVTP